MKQKGFPCKHLLILLLIIGICPIPSRAYSVLTHEAIVDALWEKMMQPLLKQKYPGVTAEQLQQAHAYAYGGAIMPDMGYFPFGSHLFTNLLHYVRSGDMVKALLDEASDVNEYAFALGALCHYNADKYGHFLGTNRSVPIEYPKMMEKYGSLVTYDEDHISHKRIEFAFDVLQTAKGNYASQAYHDFIGFQVSRPLLERAFLKIYGLDINAVFSNFSLAIETFRFSVMSLFPLLTRTAWAIKKTEILEIQQTATSKNFAYKMNKANYYEAFKNDHRRPGFFAYSLSWLIRVLPKVGPLRALRLKAPGPVAEKLFIQSFDTVLVHCSTSIKLLDTGDIYLNNIDFDTGNPTVRGEYKPADNNYGNLLIRLNKTEYRAVDSALKKNIITYYSLGITTLQTKTEKKERKKVLRALQALKKIAPMIAVASINQTVQNIKDQ